MCEIDWAVLGTWVQAIGGIGALYFLYKTFNSQNETLKEQQKITILEQKKFNDSNTPFLQLDNCIFNKNKFTNELSIEFIIRVQDNFITDFDFTHNLSSLWKIYITEYYKNSVIFAGSILEFKITILDNEEKFRDSLDIPLSDFDRQEFKYKDVIGTIFFTYKNKFGDTYNQELFIDRYHKCYLKPVCPV